MSDYLIKYMHMEYNNNNNYNTNNIRNKCDNKTNIKSTVPFFIKFTDYGTYEHNKSGIKINENSEIKFIQNYSQNTSSFEANKKIMDDSIISTDRILIHSDIDFVNEYENSKENTYFKYFVKNYIIGTVNIKISDLQIENYLLEEIKSIVNKFKTDNDIAKDLDKLFKNYGYYVPLTINYGGKIIKELNMTGNFNINRSSHLLSEDFSNNEGIDNVNNDNEFYSRMKYYIIGGDQSLSNDIEKWSSSIAYENCDIISFENLRPISEVVLLNCDHKLKGRLETPLKILNEKYEKRKKYINTLRQLKDYLKNNDLNYWKERRTSNYSDGITEENSIITVEKFEINELWRSFYVTKKTNFKSLKNNIIVGWKIEDAKERNGEWYIDENPLLKKSLVITCKSEFLRGFNYKISLYTMNYPN